MKLISPVAISLPSDSEEVKRFLTFTDRGVQYNIRKMKQNFTWRYNNPNGYAEALSNLEADLHRCLVFYDTDGNPYTYSGLWHELQQRFKWDFTPFSAKSTEEGRSIPWASIPHEMRYYQKEAVEALLASGHAGIELPTGSGKSRIILELCKRLPQKTILVAPLSGITDQLYKLLVKHFGRKYVGKYGDGKKETDKLFTVCVAQSLTRVEQGSPEWEALSKADVLIWDESHSSPAKTFEAVCMGLAKSAKTRFFLSATQLRTDGAELVLKGITGPIVYKKTFKELANEGFLKQPVFKIFNVNENGSSHTDDPKTETRVHLYENPNVLQLAANIAQKAISITGRQTVILIEEYNQFVLLKNYLSTPFEFVHGGAGGDVKRILPEEYWKCDLEKSVANFNAGQTKLLIGTSVLSTGVDIVPVGCIIYIQGLTSEIKVRQAIGRGVRPFGNTKDLWVVDFSVRGSRTMERHVAARKEIYEDIGSVEVYGD